MSNQDTEEPRRVGLLRSSGLVSLLTMLSRILGLVRDMVIANFFGAGAGADVFFLAFKIPNFFRRLFAEGAFSQAFVPVLTEYRELKSSKDVGDLGNLYANWYVLVVFLTRYISQPAVSSPCIVHF